MFTNRPDRPRRLRVLAVGAALALFATGCGNSGSDSKADPKPNTNEPGQGTTTDTDASGEVVVGEGPHGSFEAIEGVPGVSDEEIRIALLSTGDANPIGYCLMKCQADGVEAYFEYRNSQGGVHGRKLVLDVIDDGFANNQAEALKIIDGKKHFAVIGSAIMPSGLPDLAEAGIPNYVGAPQAAEAAGLPSVFMPVGSVCITCPARRNVWPVLDAGATTVGVLGFGVAQASKDCVQGTVATFERYGEETGTKVGYSNDAIAYGLPNGIAPEVSAMKRAGVDFIITCFDQNTVIKLAEELERQGMGDVPLSLPNAYGDEEYLTKNADLIEGDYIGVMYRPWEADPAGTEMVNFLEWMDKAGKPKSDWAAVSWINADLLFRGLLAAGPQFDQQKVIDATNQFTSWTAGGLTNPVDWTRQHDDPTPEDPVSHGPKTECFAFVKVEGGKQVLQGDKEKPHFCWDPADKGYKDPVATSFAEG